MLTGSFGHFSIGKADPGICIPGAPLPCFNLGSMGSSGSSSSGNISGVGSPRWKPRSGVELRLEVPTPSGGGLGVVALSGVLGAWALLSLSLSPFLHIFMLEGDPSASESGL